MGQETGIAWTDHTFNPWRGCTKVSPGCTNCYAEALSKRNPTLLGEWGPGGTRVLASDQMWREPLKWDAAAKRAGERRRVFCASLADVFEDRQELCLWRERLWRLIQQCPNLDWQLLTKRPENFAAMLPWGKAGAAASRAGVVWPHVWLGVSVEDQQRADERIPHLLRTPAAVRFLSCEPLLGPVALKGFGEAVDPITGAKSPRTDGRFWVIVGGESGPGARPCNVAWVRSLMQQCQAADVPVFVKQLGSLAVSEVACQEPRAFGLRDRKGGSPEEWPEDLRVREMPHSPVKETE